jgi:hypothetical protein
MVNQKYHVLLEVSEARKAEITMYKLFPGACWVYAGEWRACSLLDWATPLIATYGPMPRGSYFCGDYELEVGGDPGHTKSITITDRSE